VPERNDPGRLYRFLAEAIDEKWDDNDITLGRLFWWFRVAALALAAGVVTWLLVLGTT
jgi:hypothetical protein